MTYKLTPLAMRVPNSSGIYALSKHPKVVSVAEFKDYIGRDVLVSLEPDGISNPQTMIAYGLGLDCWYLAEYETHP